MSVLKAGFVIISLVCCFLATAAGCASTEQQLTLRIAEAEAIIDGLREAGVRGQATLIIEEQPMRAGLFEGIVFDSPIRLKAIVTANLNPAPLPQ